MDGIPNWLLNSLVWLSTYDKLLVWASQIFAILFFTMVLLYAQTKVFHKILSGLQQKHRVWDEALFHSLEKPLRVFIWLVGLTFVAQVVLSRIGTTEIFSKLKFIQLVSIILFLAWFLVRFIARLEYHYLSEPDKRHEKFDKPTTQAVARLLRIAVFITSALVFLQTLGIPISGILTIGGAGTLALGFAAKDLFANFFGGLMIYLDRPFSVGDWIRSPEKEIEGTVEHIGWRTTRIRCFSKRPLYVPNSVFSVVAVENPSRMTNRQITDVLRLRYKDATVLPKIVEDIEQMLADHEEIDSRQTTFVKFYNYGPSSLNCQIYCFTKTTQWVPYLKVQQDVLLKILDIVQNHGAEIAFPTQTIEVPEGIPVAAN